MTTTLLEVFDNINFCVIPYAPRSLKVLFYILFQTMVQNNLNILDLTEVTQYLILIYSSEKIPPISLNIELPASLEQVVRKVSLHIKKCHR